MSNEKKEMVRIVGEGFDHSTLEPNDGLDKDIKATLSNNKDFISNAISTMSNATDRSEINNPMVRVVDNSKPMKNPEYKEYMLCIADWDGETSWCLLNGRREVYDKIKDEIDDIDPESSYVLVENVPLSGRKNVYTFMLYAQDIYKDDDFDIRDYYDNGQELQETDAGYLTPNGDLYSKMMADYYNKPKEE